MIEDLCITEKEAEQKAVRGELGLKAFNKMIDFCTNTCTCICSGPCSGKSRPCSLPDKLPLVLSEDGEKLECQPIGFGDVGSTDINPGFE